METKLLIVEDNDQLRPSLQTYFERNGFRVTVARDGDEALRVLDQADPDLLILDVELPHRDGLEVCRAIRQRLGHSAAVIMISGVRKDLVDRVVGLEVGADVYMTKPFETRELLAQARALVRRVQAKEANGDAGGWFVVDDHLRLHFDRRLVEAGGQEVHLTRLEFDLLKYLVQRAGVPCARTDLLEEVWAYQDGLELSDAAVNTCISRLRDKIEPDSDTPTYIQAVHGVGYRFRAL